MSSHALTALIVDDEPLAREGLRMLLAEDPDVTGIHEAPNGRTAATAIRSQKPDLVFLDVQMPEMDGFSVLQEIGTEDMPAVVFVTAHDQYAIRAFEFNAIDYLLKPVTRERFAHTLDRAKARLPFARDAARQMRALLDTLASPQRYVKRLAIRSTGRTVFVNVDDIDWMQATENYVTLHAGRAEHLLQVAMSTLEKSLDPEAFLRVHRSILVNLRRIQELQPALHGEYVITLQNGIRLHSSRTYHAVVKALTANPF